MPVSLIKVAVTIKKISIMNVTSIIGVKSMDASSSVDTWEILRMLYLRFAVI